MQVYNSWKSFNSVAVRRLEREVDSTATSDERSPFAPSATASCV